MFGWSRLRWISTSASRARIGSSFSSDVSAGGITLRAYASPVARFVTVYTEPLAPDPSAHAFERS